MTQTAAPYQLVKISDEIYAISRRTGGSSQAALVRISELLRDQPEDLVGVNLAQAYPPDVLLPDRPGAHDELYTRAITAARDVLVFLPVALTWLFLSKAFVKPIPAGKTFLDVWGHDLTITAVIVSLVILLVILVTAGLHTWEGFTLARASRADLRARLSRAFIAASLELDADARRRQPVPVADVRELGRYLAVSVGGLQNELKRSTDRLKATLDTGPASRFAQSLQVWSDAAQRFSAIAPALTAPAELLQDFVEIRKELAEENVRLMKTIGALITQVQHASAAMGQESQEHHAVAENVYRLSVAMGQSMEEFIRRSEAIHRSNDMLYDRILQLVGEFEGTPDGDSGRTEIPASPSSPQPPPQQRRSPGGAERIDPFWMDLHEEQR